MEKNKNVILNSLTSFNEGKCEKSNLINEMLSLQKEMARVAFEGANDDAKIWDITAHLKEMNQDCGNAADAEVKAFSDEAYKFQNLIKSEIAGLRGEKIMSGFISTIKSKHTVVKNIELDTNERHTEIDYIVFTKKATFIIEVKNTRKDVFISESGNYYKTGKYNRFEYNIKEKLNFRENLIRDALSNAGIFNTNIISLIVFTNNKIEVKNNCKDLTIAFADQLTTIIDKYNGWNLHSEDCLYKMAEIVENKNTVKAFACDMDIEKFKDDFASAVSSVANARKQKKEEVKKPNIFSIFSLPLFATKLFKKVSA